MVAAVSIPTVHPRRFEEVLNRENIIRTSVTDCQAAGHDADIGVLFQQMRGDAVPQGVRRHSLLDPGGLGGGMDGAVELAGRERLDRIAARKQPAPRQQHAQMSALPPPGAQ
jgi:hypothetical protein